MSNESASIPDLVEFLRALGHCEERRCIERYETAQQAWENIHAYRLRTWIGTVIDDGSENYKLFYAIQSAAIQLVSFLDVKHPEILRAFEKIGNDDEGAGRAIERLLYNAFWPRWNQMMDPNKAERLGKIIEARQRRRAPTPEVVDWFRALDPEDKDLFHERVWEEYARRRFMDGTLPEVNLETTCDVRACSVCLAEHGIQQSIIEVHLANPLEDQRPRTQIGWARRLTRWKREKQEQVDRERERVKERERVLAASPA